MIQLQGWSKIWCLNIPPKLKFFLWRFCRNNILVRNILRYKGVSRTPITCPMRQADAADVEHLLHLFFDCRFAKQCWQQHMGFSYNMSTVESASCWLLERLSSESYETVRSQNCCSVMGYVVRQKQECLGGQTYDTCYDHGLESKTNHRLEGSMEAKECCA